LRQGKPQATALLPQLLKRSAIALFVLRKHESKDKENQQQRVDHALTLLPQGVGVGGYLHQDIHDLEPQRRQRLDLFVDIESYELPSD
jgi:hypothetical protein